MFTSDHEQHPTRQEFIAQWRSSEKRLERIGGLLLILAGALTLAFDQPADQMTGLAAAGSIATGMWVILRSGRPLDQRRHLYFISQQVQASRAFTAGLAAAFFLYRGLLAQRALFFIIAAICLGIAAWYRWRAYKAAQYDDFFTQSSAAEDDDLPSDSE